MPARIEAETVRIRNRTDAAFEHVCLLKIRMSSRWLFQGSKGEFRMPFRGIVAV
jgi:hypothetical protein